MGFKCWGDRVIGGEHLIVSPTDGRLICISMVALGQVKNVKSARSVKVYMTVEGRKFVIGTLSATRFPQISLNLLINKKFVISHNLKEERIYVFGYSADRATLGFRGVHPAASSLSNDKGPESSNPVEDVQDHSIYIWNLPFNATVACVTEEFTKFGPIKPGGVQVKIQREHGHCYGFVEYLSLDSKQNAIKESPVIIGGRRVVVKEKKSAIRGKLNDDVFSSKRRPGAN